MDLLALLGFIIASALIDSFDPCFYSLFVLVFTSAMLVNYTYAVKAGLAFIVAVYMGYVSLSILLRYTIIKLPVQFLALFLLAYGLIMLFTTIGKKGWENMQSGEIVCRENEIPCKIASYLRIERFTSKGILPTFLLGLMSSFTILPCSAQLLFVYISVTREYGFTAWILLTLFYVAVFVFPIVLLFIGLVFVSKLKKVHVSLLKHEKLIKIIGSLIMISISIYLLYTYSVNIAL